MYAKIVEQMHTIRGCMFFRIIEEFLSNPKKAYIFEKTEAIII